MFFIRSKRSLFFRSGGRFYPIGPFNEDMTSKDKDHLLDRLNKNRTNLRIGDFLKFVKTYSRHHFQVYTKHKDAQ